MKTFKAPYFKAALRTLKMDFLKKNLFNGAGYFMSEGNLITIKTPLTSINCGISETFKLCCYQILLRMGNKFVF